MKKKIVPWTRTILDRAHDQLSRSHNTTYTPCQVVEYVHGQTSVLCSKGASNYTQGYVHEYMVHVRWAFTPPHTNIIDTSHVSTLVVMTWRHGNNAVHVAPIKTPETLSLPRYHIFAPLIQYPKQANHFPSLTLKKHTTQPNKPHNQSNTKQREKQ